MRRVRSSSSGQMALNSFASNGIESICNYPIPFPSQLLPLWITAALAVPLWPGVNLFYGNGDGSFQAPIVGSTNRVGGLLAADFNGDGRLDLVGNGAAGGTNWMLLANGDGTFTSRQIDMIVNTVADLNGDGRPDLAGSPGWFEIPIGVSTNNGNGLFSPPTLYSVGVGGCCQALIAADLNGDGAPDLIRRSSDIHQSYVSVLLNNHDGTFRAGPDQVVGTGNYEYYLEVGDFNGDGKGDLVVTSGTYTNSVLVFLGVGDGTFRAPIQSLAGSEPNLAKTVDVNGDGKQDLVVASSDTISVLVGNGDGTFQTPVQVATAAPLHGFGFLAIGDFNGDGRPDLVVRGQTASASEIDVLLNTSGDLIPPANGLAIARDHTSVNLVWPYPSTGFSLESATRLELTNWQPAVETATTNKDGQWQVAVPTGGSQRFFRLHNPPPPLFPPVHPPVTLTNNDFNELAAAIHGVVTLAFDGVVDFTNTVAIRTNTTFDASGHTVSFDGGHLVRHFTLAEGATLRLINLTLANGRFAGADAQTNQIAGPGLGGAIYSVGGKLELIDCSFIDNEAVAGNGGPPLLFGMWGGAAYGGAICSIDGDVSATNCTFTGNACTGGRGSEQNPAGYSEPGGDAFGGAIYITNGVLSLLRSSFTNNAARAGELGAGRAAGGGGRSNGGAVADVSSSTWVDQCVFISNAGIGATFSAFAGQPESGSGNGGAWFHAGGTANVERTLFATNSATGGPGISRGGFGIAAASGKGGAVYIASGKMEILDSAVISNQANGGRGSATGGVESYVGGIGRGGGIFNAGALSATNCTLAANSARGGTSSTGGRAFGGALCGPGISSLVNTTAALNSVIAGDNLDFSYSSPPALLPGASIASGGATLINTILYCLAPQTNVDGSVVDGGHNICSDASAKLSSQASRNSTDPLLGPLSDNGGPTPTMALLPGSPAIDAGDDTACPSTDQRGVPRPAGAACDIGAFEVVPSTRPQGSATRP
jgi:FG-GAP-like repeat